MAKKFDHVINILEREKQREIGKFIQNLIEVPKGNIDLEQMKEWLPKNIAVDITKAIEVLKKAQEKS